MEFWFVYSNPGTKLWRRSAILATSVSLGEHIMSPGPFVNSVKYLLMSLLLYCQCCTSFEPLLTNICTVCIYPFEKGNPGNASIYHIFRKNSKKLFCGQFCSIASLHSARHISRAFLKQHKLYEIPFLKPLKISLFKRKMSVWIWIDQ